MKQFLPFLLLCVSVSLSAQTVSHTFHDEPLAQALETLQSHQQTYRITFIHNDLEDDIVLGAAYRAGIDYIVTHDKPLSHHSPIPCIDVTQALELVEN